MEFKIKNREWVKNAAIIFLAVLLVLTFFSNTIMNRTLPEVATQMVSNGSITAKVRGTGTVAANGLHEVKATQTRVIRAVMVKSGQEVVAGDVLFVLGEGDSAELEAAQNELRQLQASYNTTAVTNPGFDMATYNAKLAAAQEQERIAKAAAETAKTEYNDKATSESDPGLADAQKRLDNALFVRDEVNKKLSASVAESKKLYDDPALEVHDLIDSNIINIDLTKLSDKLQAEIQLRDALKQLEAAKALLSSIPPEGDTSAAQSAVDAAQLVADAAQLKLNTAYGGISAPVRASYEEAKQGVKAQALEDLNASNSEIDAAQAEVDKRGEEVASLAQGNVYYRNWQAAVKNYVSAQEAVSAIKEELATYNRTQASVGVTLTDLAVQINKAREKIKQLSGESADQITANVAGTVQSVNCTSGDTKAKDEVLCTIEVPDMGYTLSFSVTNDQAKRLRTGNTATVSNYYWGKEIKATLTNIKTDPKNPQANKLLTFDLDGDVTAGAELTISVGDKSANYDIIVPNSSIRSDTNGSFVLAVRAKNSPLGNRYIAQRVAIEVLAADDSNSAVTADLSYGDYVITTSNAPIKTGDQVRMADS